jgi:hypothetical protein
MDMLLGHRVPSPCLSLLFSFPAGRSFARFALASARASVRHSLHRLGRLVRTRTQRTSHKRHTRTGLSYFVFPDCESSPRCSADLVFSRCMKMNPLAPPAGGAFFMHAVLCATGAASAALSGSQLAGNGCRVARRLRLRLAGCYLTPRRRVSISMTMKPAARTVAFKFSVSAKSAAPLRNSKKVLIRLFDLASGCAAALTLDGD